MQPATATSKLMASTVRAGPRACVRVGGQVTDPDEREPPGTVGRNQIGRASQAGQP